MKTGQTIVGFHVIDVKDNNYLNDTHIEAMRAWIENITSEDISIEHFEFSDNAIKRLADSLGYESVYKETGRVIILPDGRNVFPCVVNSRFENGYLTHPFIRLTTSYHDDDIKVEFTCLYKYIDYEQLPKKHRIMKNSAQTELKTMLTLTKKEAFDVIKAHEEFEKYYYFDGSPKVKEVGTEAVELICNFYFNDEQVKIIKSWVESITGFETINEWDIPYVDIVDNEIERLAGMLGGEIIDDHIDKRILIGGIEIDVELDDEDEEFTLTIHQYNHNRENHTLITFSGEFVYEEVRKLKLKELK